MPDNAQLTEDERRAEEVYDRLIAPIVKTEDDGKFVVIAFNVDDFEIDRHEYTAVQRLSDRHPEERMWIMRTGKRPALKSGPRRQVSFDVPCAPGTEIAQSEA